MPSTGIDIIRLSFLQWLDGEESIRQEGYTTFREYYGGDHPTQLTTRQKKFLELPSGESWCLNLCPIVVDSLAEKLKITGFTCGNQDELLWEWWQLARMDAVQAVVHLAGVRDGDTYLLTEWNNEHKRPTWTQENAYDGTEGVQIIYSNESRTTPLVAIKKWLVTSGAGAGDTRRANLYYPDRIEKYVSSGAGSWREYADDKDQRWPIPWMHKGEPMGIPVTHFRNRDQGYSYGESELSDVIAPQNLLNKSAIDLAAAADTTAFRIPWMTGGKPENMQFAIGSWTYTTDPNAKVGALDGADLTGLIALKDSIAADIAKITRTPLSYFQISGQTPAEGSQKQQESGLLAKVADRQVVFGNSWEDAIAMGRKLHNEFGGGGLDEEVLISAQWMDPEERNEKEHLESLKIKRELGIPEEAIWGEMGYDATRIAEMQELKAAEEARGVSSFGAGLLEQERRFGAGL